MSARSLVLWLALAVAGAAQAQGSLGIPGTIEGYPTNVGFLVIGHSTSAQGAYPAKLVSALNDLSHVADARHYVAFNAITGGDGGLLWSLVSVDATDTRYHRATASQAVGESPQPQWCEDAATTRWSCAARPAAAATRWPRHTARAARRRHGGWRETLPPGRACAARCA